MVYVVQPGDTLFSIAQRFGVTVSTPQSKLILIDWGVL